MRFRARYLLVCGFAFGSGLSFAQEFGGGIGGGEAPQGRRDSMHDVDLSAEIRQLRQLRREDVVSPRDEHSPDLPVKKIDNAFEMSPAMERIHRSLAAKGDFDFHDTPINEVIQWLEENLRTNVEVDQHAVEDEGIDIGSDSITFHANNMTYRAALRYMLVDLNLTFVAEQEILIVTSKEKSEEMLVTRVYLCSSIIDVPEPVNQPRLHEELESLSDVIQSTIVVDSWDQVGGPASIGLFPARGLLVISQVDAGHAKIQKVLEVLARGRAGGNASPKPNSLDPAEIIVKSYTLSRRFVTKETQLQLVDVLEKLLNGADRNVNLGDPEFVVTLLGQQLIISHRRDVHEPLREILKKLGALGIDAESPVTAARGGGMF